MNRNFLLVLLLCGLVTLLLAGCAEDPIEQLSKDIDAQDYNTRLQAVKTLGQMEDERSVELLIEVLEGDEELLAEAAYELVRKGRETVTPEAPDPVVDAVGRTLKDLHLEEEIRVTAAWILGEIGDREALPALGACASDKKVKVKTEVALSRQKLGFIDPAQPYDISPEELPFGPDAHAL